MASMRFRTTLAEDGSADVKILISHPMETGLRKDAKTGELVPAHFIQDVTVAVNGETVLTSEFGSGVSKNPLIGFKLKSAKAGDKITVRWSDNKGAAEDGEYEIK